jgi:hypothetical protein
VLPPLPQPEHAALALEDVLEHARYAPSPLPLHPAFEAHHADFADALAAMHTDPSARPSAVLRGDGPARSPAATPRTSTTSHLWRAPSAQSASSDADADASADGQLISLAHQRELCAVAVTQATPLLAATRHAAFQRIIKHIHTPPAQRTHAHTNALATSLHNLCLVTTHIAEVASAHAVIAQHADHAHQADEARLLQHILARSKQTGANITKNRHGHTVYAEQTVKTRTTRAYVPDNIN